MEVEHLSDVHTIDVVGAEDGHMSWCVLLDKVNVLEYGVSGTLEPFEAFAHLRRDDGNELVAGDGCLAPVLLDVRDQGLRFVLDEQIDGIDTGVDDVTQDKVDDSVPSPEWHRRFGAHSGKREKTPTLTTGKYKC
jgi:hypothetical protein